MFSDFENSLAETVPKAETQYWKGFQLISPKWLFQIPEDFSEYWPVAAVGFWLKRRPGCCGKTLPERSRPPF
jgi:hypothetical protein